MGNTKSNILYKDENYKYCGEIKHLDNDKWVAEGKGSYEVNGNIYIGEFKNNQASGNGICTYTDGSKYTGTWISDFKHGKGKLEFINGDYYEGEFKYDMINGHGKYVYPDQTYYIGNFINNKLSGKGKLYTDKNILLYDGEWLNDVFHSYGTYYYSNKKICYQGRWKNSKTDGYGVFYDKKGKKYCGYFKEGEYIGETIECTYFINNEVKNLEEITDDVKQSKTAPINLVNPLNNIKSVSDKIIFSPKKINHKVIKISKDINIMNPINNFPIIETAKQSTSIKNPLFGLVNQD